MDSWCGLLVLFKNSFERFLDRLLAVEGNHVRQVVAVDDFLYNPQTPKSSRAESSHALACLFIQRLP